MQRFSYYSQEDYESGLFINARLNNLTTSSLSPYTLAQIEVDSASSPSTTTYFGTVPVSGPWQFIGGKDYETTTPYAVYTIPSSQTVGAYRIDIACDTSISGAFCKQYIDFQNLPNIDTYNPVTDTIALSSIPLNGIVGQTVSLYHSGFANKKAQYILGPLNITGQSLAPGVTITPNGTTPILQDNWTITANSTNWTLHRASTNTNTPYGYNESLVNIVPGFTTFVNNGSIVTNDVVSLATYPAKLDLLYYTLYQAKAPNGQWITPIMDSQDQNTNWLFARWRSKENSTTCYLNSLQVGQTETPDSTWIQYIPPTISPVDFDQSIFTEAYRSNAAFLGNLNGRFAQASFTMNDSNDFIQDVNIYCWNPVNDPSMQIQGPVIQGPNIQALVAAFTIALKDWQIKYEQFANSFAVSTSEREYLFAKGSLLNTPLHINETLTAYRNRLEIVARGLTQAGTLSYMQDAIQAYTGSTAAYVKELLHSNITWQLGLSDIGIDTFVGQAAVNAWAYEVHVPGAGLYDPDGLVKFVKFLNPIGAIPIFIFE